MPIAPGKRVSERVQNGRRIARFVSDVPIKNLFSIQSGRYAVRRLYHGGVEHAVYFHPAHHWNVDRMMTAMQASIDYYSRAFGPYQFDQARIVARPGLGGGQAFPNTIAVGEGIFAMDLRGGNEIDDVQIGGSFPPGLRRAGGGRRGEEANRPQCEEEPCQFQLRRRSARATEKKSYHSESAPP